MRKLFSQTIEKEVLQPMAKCQFCDKGVSFGIQVSKPQHVYACTRCLRSGKVTRAV